MRWKWHRAKTVFLCLAVLAGVGLVQSDNGPEHQTRQARPIQLGVSGGSLEDFDFPFCCTGTLGSLVQDVSGNQYILSNNHVMARSNRAAIGEHIVRPGLIEVGCAQNAGDSVGDLTDYVPLSFTGFNQADVAIARVRSGMVRTDGSILDIGVLGPNWRSAAVGLEVKKSGRTTGLTTGQVAAVDVSINVMYPSSCGASFGPVASFINQVRISPGSFIMSGDSGSLAVENVSSNPRATALMFAGSSSSAFGNRIEAVFGEFGGGVTQTGTVYQLNMVSGEPPPPPPPPEVGTITGVVTSSADGSPIAGANVQADSGQSDTTAADGSYTLTDVPAGTHDVTASATGFVSQTQSAAVTNGGTTTLNFSLVPVAAPGEAVVRCVTYNTNGGRTRDRHMSITLRIENDMGAALSGASVTYQVIRDGAALGTFTGSTNSSGELSASFNNSANACYTVAVTNVVAAGLAFNGTQPANGFAKGTDAVPDADCLESSDDCGGSPFVKLGRIPPGQLESAIRTKRDFEPFLRGRAAEVVGVGLGAENGRPVIEVYLSAGRPDVYARIPAQIGGMRVRPVVVGVVMARPGAACQNQK